MRPNRFSWLGFFKILPIGVGLVSGILGVTQQIILLYSLNPNPIWQEKVFWSFVWIAFVISSIIAWLIEHKKVRSLETRIQESLTPKLSGRILNYWIQNSAERNAQIIFFFFVRISNQGQPSIASDYVLYLTFPEKEPVLLEPIHFAKKIIIKGNESYNIELSSEEAIYNKTSTTLIPTNGAIAGHLAFACDLSREELSTSSSTILFKDGQGNPCQIFLSPKTASNPIAINQVHIPGMSTTVVQLEKASKIIKPGF
jgi:hypothetical protein